MVLHFEGPNPHSVFIKGDYSYILKATAFYGFIIILHCEISMTEAEKYFEIIFFLYDFFVKLALRSAEIFIKILQIPYNYVILLYRMVNIH